MREIQHLGKVYGRKPHGRERLESLLEIYTTALDELRAMTLPAAGGLIASLESLRTRVTTELRYHDSSQAAERRLHDGNHARRSSWLVGDERDRRPR